MSLIILDRDGVINFDSEHYIKTPDEWRPIPGSLEAIALLKAAGFTVAIATNQSGIGRGFYDEQTLEAIHDKMQHLLAELGEKIDGIFYCPHKPEDGCQCRKPLPGLLIKIQRHFDLPLAGAPLVGDTLRDLQAAMAVGAQPILVKTGNGEKTLAELDPTLNIPCYNNLSAYVQHLLALPTNE